MKSETFTFKDTVAGVTLEFSFPTGENMIAQKKAFLELLKKAIIQLEEEVKK